MFTPIRVEVYCNQATNGNRCRVHKNGNSVKHRVRRDVLPEVLDMLGLEGVEIRFATRRLPSGGLHPRAKR